MLILLDVGNTSITHSMYRGGRFQGFGSSLENGIPKLAINWTKNGPESGIDMVISSVVPRKTEFILKSMKRYQGLKFWVVGKNLPIRIKHNYRNASRLGVDRMVNIYGAIRLYKPPFLILDFGTAITADYVSKAGVFEGGMIIPGPELSFQALIERAALLPKNLRLPHSASSFLGVTTYECVSSGILQGYGAMIDGLVERFRKRYGKNLRVLATGGFVPHLRRYTRSFDIVDPRLSVRSLALLFQERTKA